ncbi:hypothetical protein BGZ93_000634, partial [Podila epicladia]
MARQGISDGTNEIPPLDTLKILWSLDTDITNNYLTENTIGPLVDKSISYLESLPVPEPGLEGWLE